jgi:chitinase
VTAPSHQAAPAPAATAPAVVSVAPAAAAPVAAAEAATQTVAQLAPITGLIKALLAPFSGNGTGSPVESPLAWAALAVTRRLARVAALRTPAALVTTGQTPSAAATTGTTTTVTWAWGTNPVLAFNPATDKLDFGWMGPTQFDVTEKSGSTVISVVGNNHSYTLQNVGVSQLTTNNIVAKDASTVSKWQTLIGNAAPSVPAVSIANATVAEGNSGTTNAAFAVTLSKPSTKTVTVGYSTANGTATAGSDYTAASGTLTFAPGVTSQNVNIAVLGDTAVEPDETFTVKLANATNAALGAVTGTGTITNDDAAPVTPPTISIANAAVAEGNSGSTNMAFTATLSKASDKTVTVGYATANGTATAGSDYTAASGTLTFAPGVTAQQVNVSVIGDTTVEPTETFTVALSNPTNGTLATATATGTITNDDGVTPPPVTADRWGKSFYAPYVDMGGWPVPDLLAISQAHDGGSLFTAAFMQATPDGKLAWAGLNALTPDATNDQAKAINSSIKALQAAGGDVMVSLGGQAGTSLAQWGSTHGMTAQQLANAYSGVIDTYGITHLDFDIEGAAVADPASIALNSQALKLLQQSKPQVQVWYTLPVLPTGLTADGLKVVDSALKAGVKLAGVNVMAMDYGESAAPTSGANAKTMGAYAIQSTESTYTQLSNLYSGYGQSFGYSQLGVTPMLGVNDITSEVFTLADAQAVEDYARSKGLGMIGLWSVTRDTPGQLGVSTYTHSGMSVPAGSFAKIFDDYGTVNALNYGTTGGGGSTGGGSGTGGSTTPVTGGTTTTIGWNWGTNTVLNFDTAKDKLDFVWMQPTNFDISESAGSTKITIVGNNQTYTLNNVPLSTMSMGNIVALDSNTVTKWQNAIATAQSSAAPTSPTLSIAGTTVSEGNSGSADATFAVSLSKAATSPVTVGYSTADGTATAGQDYTAASGTLTFAPGTTTQQVKVKVTGDTTVEPTETFTVTLTSPTGATLATATATGTITNDDAAPALPTVSVANATVAEGNTGTANLAFTVTLSKAATTAVTVGYSTANGTATAGQDYTAASGTLTFAPGVTSQTVNVGVIGDTTVEPTETLTVTLTSPTGATLATATATGTITNDDAAAPAPAQTKILAAYYPEWGVYGRNFQPADIPANELTHVIYSFLNLTPSGEVAIYDSYAAVEKRFTAAESVSGEADLWYYPPSDPRSQQTVWGNFNQLAQLKQKNPNLRVNIALGGWTLSSNFSNVVATAAGREKLANSIVNFLNTYRMFDGIDFDWEYPGGGGLDGNSASPNDGANYAELLKVVRTKLDGLGTQLGRTYEISVASPAGYDKIDNFNLAGLAPSVNYFNLMTYDFHGTWEKTTGHMSGFTGDPKGYDVKHAVDLYLAAGIDPNKIVLGAPLYTKAWSGVADGGDGGYLEPASGSAPGSFEAGTYDYKDLLAQLKDPNSGWKLYWDDNAQAAYLYNKSKGLFSSFETPTSIAQKSEWAQALGLRGMMFWDISNDAVTSPDSLVKAAYDSWMLHQSLATIRTNSSIKNETIIGGDGAITAIPASAASAVKA